MVKSYQIGRECCICNRDYWVDGTKLFMKVFMLTSTIKSCGHITVDNGKKLVGIGHDDKNICIPCLMMLIGLEDYYDQFYYKLLDNLEAKKIINLIQSDKKLLNKVAKIRSEGKYIPLNIIMEVKQEAMQSKARHSSQA